MGQEITLTQFRRWLLVYADRIAAEEMVLTELDAAIGDADHGANMQRGMTKVRERLADPGFQSDDIGSLLRTVGMTLISSVGGAAGPLYGAFFLRAAQAMNHDSQGANAVSLAQLAAMFRNGLEGVQQRGKAQIEDKTMVDALQPAVEALERAAADGATVTQALEAARAAATKGAHRTIEIQANKGRASYLGSRSVGHQDPGATSVLFLVEAAVATLGQATPLNQPATPV
jgi:dihydroxyacetone kinase-like protein